MIRRIGAVAVLAVLFLLGVCAFSPDALAFGDRLQVTIVRLSQDGTATPLPNQGAAASAVPMPQPPGTIVGDLTPLPNQNNVSVDNGGGDCSGSSYSYRASSSAVSVYGNASRREARHKARHVEKSVGFTEGAVSAFGAGASGASGGVGRSKSVERYRN